MDRSFEASPPPSGDSDRVRVQNLIARLDGGDPSAADELFPLVYDRLRELARAQMRNARFGHTLQPTALVHEAWLRMCGNGGHEWNGRDHFMKVAAVAMRRILVDHARKKRAGKRPPPESRMELDEVLLAFEERAHDLLELDEALRELHDNDPTMARFVELRFFGGLTIDEAARAVGVTPMRGIRMWRNAKAWLRTKMH